MLVVTVDDVRARRAAVVAALAAGIDGIQLRDRRAAGAALLAAARELRALTRDAGAALLVNDRIDVAMIVTMNQEAIFTPSGRSTMLTNIV